MNALEWIVSFLYAAMLAGVPLLLGTLGEIMTEKAGHINLGVEGMMYMGAVTGFYVAYASGSALLAIVSGAAAGTLGALIYAVLTVSLKANQNVAGLTLTIFGTGLANFIGENLNELSVKVPDAIVARVRPIDMGILSDIPVVGKLVLNHSPLTYLAVLLAVLLALYLKRTQAGLNLRAVGENPGAADAAGVNVTRVKYTHILAGGAISALGGVYISLVTCNGNWQQSCVGGQGWIAVALVIFASWSPARAILGSLVFGALSVLKLYIPVSLIDIPAAFFSMIPFIVTCVVLVVSSVRRPRENRQPACCGVNYFREER